MNTEMNTIDNDNKIEKKNISSAISFISELESTKQFVLEGPHTPVHGFYGHLTKKNISGYNYEIGTSLREFSKIRELSSIVLKTANINYNVRQMITNTITFNNYIGTISDFVIGEHEEEKESYYRLVIKRKKNLHFTFFFEFGYPFRTENITSIEQIKTQINDNHFDIYLVSMNDVQHLIIDSKQKINFDVFSASIYSICLSYGFITGQLPLDEGYYFSYSDIDHINQISCKYSSFIPSIETSYSPIYTNAHGIIDDFDKANELNDSLKGISEAVFSRLCTEVFNSKEFRSCLHLFLEGTQGSLLMMAGSFSICLETITSIIYADNKDRLNPIKSEADATEIVKELISVVENHREAIADGYDVIKIKISNINSPPNSTKLLKPFEILGVKLNCDDFECINKRNNFLHGNVAHMLKKKGQVGNETGHLFHIVLKLATLISSLILKYVGFEGKILNQAKIHSGITKIDLKEEIYREI